MAFKPSYNIMDRDTHNALVNAFQTGGIAYTDDDGTVHKIADDYVNSGGGSSLPSVTSADEGKVLAVATTYTKGAPIVPEQTVTLDDEKNAVCANVNPDLFADETKVIAVVNGEEYQDVIREGEVYLSEGECFYLDDSIFYYNDEGEVGSQFNVALYVAVPQYGWAAEQNIMTISCSGMGYSVPTLNSSKLNHTYKEIVEALNNGVAIICQFIKKYTSPDFYDGAYIPVELIELAWEDEYYITLRNTKANISFGFSALDVDDELICTYIQS